MKYINAVLQINEIIEKVELRDNLNLREYGRVKTRKEIIDFLKQGGEIYTALRDSQNPFLLRKGAKVIWFKQKDGDEFITTEGNGQESDNLENLPTSPLFML